MSEFVRGTVAMIFNFAGCTSLLFAIPFGLFFMLVAGGAAVIGASEFAIDVSKGVGIAAIYCMAANALLLIAFLLVRRQPILTIAVAYLMPIPLALYVYWNVDTIQFFKSTSGVILSNSTTKNGSNPEPSDVR